MRPHPVIFLALALSTIPALAQDGPDPPQSVQSKATPKPPKPTGTITGTVFCADTHKPARGATVILAPIPASDGTKPQGAGGMDEIGRVSMDGTYTLVHVPPGEYTVVAILPGYLSALEDYLSGEVNPDEKDTAKLRTELLRYGSLTIHNSESAHFDVTLQRGATISGRVLYSDGSPATQITLEIQNVAAKSSDSKSAQNQIAQASMFRSMFTHQTNATDDVGHFRISGLKPGTYRVAAISPQKGLFEGAANDGEGMGGDDEGIGTLLGIIPDSTALHIYSGDTLHQKSAKTYELRPGDDLSGIDITIPLNAFHRVQGTLTAKDGRLINFATLTLTDAADDSVTFSTHVNEEGLFTFPAIPSGTYNLTTKSARIITHNNPITPGTNMNQRSPADKITAMFSTASTSIVVGESDMADVTVPLTETPIPANADNQPDPTDPAQQAVTPIPPQ